jgi:hypothetical protein
MTTLLFLVVLFVEHIFASGEIKIKNQPAGVVWCNTTHELQFSYAKSAVPDGTTLVIQLMFDAFDVQLGGNVGVGNNAQIAELGRVVAPATAFNVTLPTPFPAEWTGNKKLSNDGKSQKVLYRVKRVDNNNVNSDCTALFCRDPSFAMVCCDPSQTTTCGCKDCSCANDDVCNEGLQCDYGGDDGVCKVPLPGLGDACPDLKCAAPYACRCPDVFGATTCQNSLKTCVDDLCPKPTAGVPGRFNCPCSPAPENLCQAGTFCSLYFCRVSQTATIDTLPCVPSESVLAKDACMLHKDGSTNGKTYSCQGNICKRCVPGTTLCVCSNTACADSRDQCEGGRCYPRTGCEGCACGKLDNSCKAPGTICISATCTRIITPAPETVGVITRPITEGKTPSAAPPSTILSFVILIVMIITTFF